jgi:hypothetical protein
MMWVILGFAVATLGSKVLLGMWCIWALLPAEQECARCDGETTQIESARGLRALYRWCHIQNRWCPRCGESFLARGKRPPEIYVGERRPEPRRTKVTT